MQLNALPEACAGCAGGRALSASSKALRLVPTVWVQPRPLPRPCLPQSKFGNTKNTAVRVVPSWVPVGDDTELPPEPLFIGYRTGLGVDAGLLDSHKGHVLLYTSRVASNQDALFTNLAAVMTGGQRGGLAGCACQDSRAALAGHPHCIYPKSPPLLTLFLQRTMCGSTRRPTWWCARTPSPRMPPR